MKSVVVLLACLILSLSAAAQSDREGALKAAVAAEREFARTWTPAFADVSQANDLGYTFGSYEIRDALKKITEKGNYLRIWKKAGGDWKAVVDVADPLPEEKSN